MRLADAFRIFDVVYVLTASGPANTTDVLSTYIYRQMFAAFDFPGAAAAAVMLVLITGLFSLIVVLALRAREANTEMAVSSVTQSSGRTRAPTPCF